MAKCRYSEKVEQDEHFHSFPSFLIARVYTATGENNTVSNYDKTPPVRRGYCIIRHRASFPLVAV